MWRLQWRKNAYDKIDVSSFQIHVCEKLRMNDNFQEAMIHCSKVVVFSFGILNLVD